ncbi:hypothetical protein, conserved [Trypanosoma brucei gambiense DAL972]|uniref:Uncharacterized protein n=2 Tax=Trypanosoma brucei TaxID=5691 RepID=C9ZV00_TRYB9|nr:hypothetical protein, conserved [Trypanosoma brucei gambiense DAL972]RHW70821.1 hypothetical protein DPX39_080024500 [Trypanosoma brucei equiperdum]CBH13238.1 hypothetical protein, conserved [Trypanosoma brucei gambiense DAL972]|eukprot:XP_011775515.1 hypothetical protein, conserved [Trypanosoma brucei gambiense DAL972]
MNIVTSYFLVKRIPGSIFLGEASLRNAEARQREYLECIRQNVTHREVDSLHLLIEGSDAYNHFRTHIMENNNSFPDGRLRQKIVPILWQKGQPTYADLFEHANKLLRGRLAMVCNADVYISQHGAAVRDLARLFDQGVPRVALALTRYESENFMDAPLQDNYRGSHDAFVVRPPLEDSLLRSVKHPQNCYKAENVVLHELQRHGYMVKNPCRDFMLVHRHEADLRQWLPSVDEERYARAPPCSIEEAVIALKEENDRLERH